MQNCNIKNRNVNKEKVLLHLDTRFVYDLTFKTAKQQTNLKLYNLAINIIKSSAKNKYFNKTKSRAQL